MANMSDEPQIEDLLNAAKMMRAAAIQRRDRELEIARDAEENAAEASAAIEVYDRDIEHYALRLALSRNPLIAQQPQDVPKAGDNGRPKRPRPAKRRRGVVAPAVQRIFLDANTILSVPQVAVEMHKRRVPLRKGAQYESSARETVKRLYKTKWLTRVSTGQYMETQKYANLQKQVETLG